MNPIRLTVAMTHPVQYSAPWFRFIAKECPEIDLTVLYAAEPSPAQQGTGFGVAFSWDVALTEGYRNRFVRAMRPRENLSSESFWGLNVSEIGRAIVESHPQVVLLPGWHSITLVRALIACRLNRIPVLYRGDSNMHSAAGGVRSVGRAMRTRAVLRLFDGYLSPGLRAKEYLLRLGASDTKIFGAPHSVDNDVFGAAAAPYRAAAERLAQRSTLGFGPDDFVILYVGKLVAKKRPLDVIRAARHLGPSVSLLMVGAGELEAEARREADRLGIRARWEGFLNQSELGRAYGVADCLVLPSEGEETWGLVVNEAMASGLPCVVSDRVGCGPDLVTRGETGDVFRTGDITALGQALARVRQQGKAGHDWTKACRNRVARYSFERATAGLLAACRYVVTVRRPGTAMSGSGAHGQCRVIACCGGMVIVGGLERSTFEVLGALRRQGAVVHCIVNSWASDRIISRAKAIDAGWSVGAYRIRLERHTRNPLKVLRMLGDIVATSCGLLRDAWRFRPTHLLVPDFVAVVRNAPALIALRVFGVHIILHLNNAPERGRFYRRLWKWGIDRCVDHYVCNSEFTRDELRAHGIAGPKMSLIYYTVPARDGSPVSNANPDPGKVIYVGQIIPEKGVHVLLEAVGRLVRDGLDVRLDVVGEIEGWVSPRYGNYREALIARAQEPDLQGRVRFLGWREDVPALLSGAAVHCCPSLAEQREAFGIVNIEAKQAGVPSVVFPSGALPELIRHREDGWVCAEFTASALAEGLSHFLSDAACRERAGRAARASVERFGSQQFAEAWWALFSATMTAETGAERTGSRRGRRFSSARTHGDHESP